MTKSKQPKAPRAPKVSERAETYSIFGQIEGVVADSMVADGLALKIEQQFIPPQHRYNDRGQVACCALLMNRTQAAEFDRRVANLYA